MDLPFINYHTSLLLDKVRRGDVIRQEDVNAAIYGSALYRIVKPYFSQQSAPLYIPQSYQDKVRKRYDASYQTRRRHRYNELRFRNPDYMDSGYRSRKSSKVYRSRFVQSRKYSRRYKSSTRFRSRFSRY